MARIALITDTWKPQVNGAVTTLANTVYHLGRLGHSVDVIETSQFRSWPCPTYPEIRLARTSAGDMMRRIDHGKPDNVLIATEGPLGYAARNALRANGMSFTTAFFTRFHDYLWLRFAIPRSFTLRWLDWFHRPAARVLTPTPAMQRLLHSRGLPQATAWVPGVDFDTFSPAQGVASALVENLPRPIHLYVGRLAVEKNIDAFLSLELEGSKVLVGDGPLMLRLRRQFPRAIFLGYRNPQEIAEICSACDVMVFPSRTDTFGHVIVESLACGLPVAAYQVQGPTDILTDPTVGATHVDLAKAIAMARQSSPSACMQFARNKFCWEKSTLTLLQNLVPTHPTPKRYLSEMPLNGPSEPEPAPERRPSSP